MPQCDKCKSPHLVVRSTHSGGVLGCLDCGYWFPVPLCNCAPRPPARRSSSHACSCGRESGPASTGTSAVVLTIADEESLLSLHRSMRNIPHTLITEVDPPYHGQAMAIGALVSNRAEIPSLRLACHYLSSIHVVVCAGVAQRKSARRFPKGLIPRGRWLKCHPPAYIFRGSSLPSRAPPRLRVGGEGWFDSIPWS